MAGTVFIFGLGYVGRPLGHRLAAAPLARQRRLLPVVLEDTDPQAALLAIGRLWDPEVAGRLRWTNARGH